MANLKDAPAGSLIQAILDRDFMTNVASQDYRDGVAMGAKELASRIVEVQQYGIAVDYANIDKMVAAITEEWGGIRGPGLVISDYIWIIN